ncbi:hypothetical protein CAPTEDRAFT_167530 [Capitella teleta]|uniref:Lengsin n=1 Tax=Capitella teleta TaxID=283909 RepID=X1ZB31_CAPTE|nr:hypothetical protein CAPTEDRAFT_167530 [Capitella teleta]|eukprot:ELU10090.1 hypothetical protein CAPTEDRAFT_167530 [Capitella teleta]
MILNTRFLARRQLQRLEDRGYKMLSAVEMEQFFLNRTTLEPLFHEADYNSTLILHKHENLLFDMQDKLTESGIEVTSVKVELSPGQFEFTLEPKFGIECADMAFRCREALIEVGLQHDVQVTFMPKIGAKIFPAGAHYNHSLWTLGHECAFYDAEDPDKMSDVARYWIGGIQKHACAMTAVVCPTVNCYHRLHRPWTLSHNGWIIASRVHTFRMKVGEPGSTYLENRLPSSASNPYLVMAATIAAGVDGIQNKIEPVTGEGLEELPHSLDEALTLLEADEVLVEALGKDFVQMFCGIKRELEIEKLKDVCITEDREEDFEMERKMYLMTP